MRMKLSDVTDEESAVRLIEYHLSRHGSHTHNLLGLALRRIAEVLGKDHANWLIDEYDLEDLYGLNKEYD